MKKIIQISIFTLFISALIISNSNSVAFAAAPSAGLVGYWSLDEGSGSSVGNPAGSLTGSPTWSTGKIGQALTFNGSNYISVPATSVLNPGSSLWSVSAWVKGSGDGTIVWKGATTDLYKLGISGGKAIFNINAGGTSVNAVAISSASVNDGNWHLITGIRSATKTVDIYVDGNLSGSASYTGNGLTIDTNTALTIASENGSASFYNGSIDDIRIYNVALSATDVSDIYNAAASTGGGGGTTNPPSGTDTTVPVISLTNPITGATVSGSVTISASASDNIGLLGVQFTLDGNNFGSEDILSPYTINLDTTSISNGSHTITARARDAAGNTANTSSVITVNNTAVTPTNTCPLPSQILNLTNWKITLPIGSPSSPTEIKQPQLASYSIDPYFKSNTNCDAVLFRGPTNGVTTSGSSYPRSELREMTNNGITNASWGTNDGMSHSLFVDEAITAVPTGKKHVVAGQIHDAVNDVIVIRLQFPKLFIDINGVNGPTLDANYTLGKRFTFKFTAHDGMIDVYYNGSLNPVYTLTLNSTGDYFKVGSYTQSNCTTESAAGATCGDTNYGEVAVYNVSVQHNNIVTIPTPDTQAPTIPSNVLANAVSSSQINLSWTNSTDNVGVSSYLIYRNNIQIASTTGNAYSDTGLTASTLYSYSVSARDTAGNISTKSNTYSATTLPVPIPPNPPVPSGGSPLGLLPSGITQVSMSLVTDKNAICKYSNIANTPYSLMTSTLEMTGALNHSTTLYGLQNGVNYTYYIRCDSQGLSNTGDYIISFSVSSPIAVTVSKPPIAGIPYIFPSSAGAGGGAGVAGAVSSPVTNPNPTITIPAFSTAIYPGVTNPEVNRLQNFLISQGVLVLNSTTNYYGALTTAAVKDFQRLNNISQTGIVDNMTLILINKKISEGIAIATTPSTLSSSLGNITKALVFGMTDKQVTLLQKFLVAKGYLKATPTGYYGSLTRAAVIKFQAANGIAQIGAVGPMTRAAINGQLK